MDLAILNYYFFKDIAVKLKAKKLPFEYNDDLLFNLANFNSMPLYYDILTVKKDRYKTYDTLNDSFDEFIVECIIKLNKENDYQKLLFLYAMISHDTLMSYVNSYIHSIKKSEYSFRIAQNMLDYYYGNRLNIDVTRKSLYKLFPTAFTYYDYQDELIHDACIKVLHLMSSDTYFKRCYKRSRRINKHRNLFAIKYPISRIFDTISKKPVSTKDLLYKRKLDMDLLNDKKRKVKIGSIETKETLSDLITRASNKAMDRINAVNIYLFEHIDTKLRKEFDIPKDKQL